METCSKLTTVISKMNFLKRGDQDYNNYVELISV